MKRKVISYTAMTTAAALFTALGSTGLAMADSHHEDDDDDEDDDDGGVVVQPICPVAINDIEATIQSEVNSSAAVVSAQLKLTKAQKALRTAVVAERKSAATYAKANKAAKTASARTAAKALRTKYKDAHVVSVNAATALTKAKANLEAVRVRSEQGVRSRYHLLCDFVDPTATPTDPAVTPTPVDTTGPSITPTPTPTPTTPTPTPTTPTPTPTTPTPTPTTPTPVSLSAPTNLAAGTATSLNTGAFRLTWTAVTGATSYKVLRDGVQIGTSATTTFTPSVTAGARHNYSVIATDGTNDSPESAVISAGEYIGTAAADKRGAVTYGNIQVYITVVGTRMTGCWATYPTSSDSGVINRSAIPTLCAQAITLQTANVSTITGASATVPAFKTSLQAALTAAGI